jgi:O-antigen/teichoic acid export membrane protein
MRRLPLGRFTKQVGSTFLTQVLVLFIALGNGAITARWLGPAGKGMLGLALLLPTMLGLFLSGGLGAANVYFGGSKRLGIPILSVNSVAFAIIASTLGFLVIVGLTLTGWLTKLVPGVPVWALLLATLALPIGLLSGYFSAILQGLRQITALNAISLGQGTVGLLLTFGLVAGLGWGLAGGILAALLSGLSGLIGMAVFVHRAGGKFRPRWERPIMHKTLSYGLRGYVGNLLQFFNYRLDAFIVNYFIGPAGAGIYGVAVAMAEMLWYLPNSVGFVIFPKAAATSPEEMNRFTPRVFRVTLGLTALGAAALALLGRLLIDLIYSSAFASAYVPLVALLPGVVLLGGAKVLTNEIAGRGYLQYNSINSGIALVLTIILDLVLIPRYGVLGAAVASSIAYTAIFFTAIIFYRAVSRRVATQSSTEKVPE